MNGKILILAIALAGTLSRSAGAQSVALPAGTMFRDVRLVWEGRNLIFYGTFKQYGHDLPIWLEWHGAKIQGGRAEIDYIEQYGRDMPIAVTIMSLGKIPDGQEVLYMGRPAPNTPRVENLDLQAQIAIGEVEDYHFLLLPPGSSGTLPRIMSAASTLSNQK